MHTHPGRTLLVCSVYQHIIIYKHTVLTFMEINLIIFLHVLFVLGASPSVT